MLLEQIADDPALLPPRTLQRKILKGFSGVERTQAVLEYCAIYRKTKHANWIRNLIGLSDSEDLVHAVNEWVPVTNGNTQAIFYRYGGTGCELDGVGIREIHLFNNRKNDNKLRIGKVCAAKITKSNLFGDAGSHVAAGEGGEGNGWEIDISSMVDWFGANEQNVPSAVMDVIYQLLDDAEITDREKNVMVDYYDNNRYFHPSELVGETELQSLRNALSKFRTHLPADLSSIVFSQDLTTRKQAEPLMTFMYQDHRALVTKIKENAKARRAIDMERARLEFSFPEIEKMGELIIKYIGEYEQVNKTKMHGLTKLILPIRLYQSGLFMSDEDAAELNGAYTRHRNYTKDQLVEKRDERFRVRRETQWQELEDYRTKTLAVYEFLDELTRRISTITEVSTTGGKRSSQLGDDIWKVVNGVVKSGATGKRTGYVTRDFLLEGCSTEQHHAETNLRDFLAAGFAQGRFPIKDKIFYADNVANNFPEAFQGIYPEYEIPAEIWNRAYDDAQKIRDKSQVQKTLSNRRISLNVLQETVNETLRRFKYRGRDQ